MMLHGTFPSIRLNEYYDKQLLIDTLMHLDLQPGRLHRQALR